MKDIVFRKELKIVMLVIQAAAVGFCCCCFLNIVLWIRNSEGVSQIFAASYEESNLFFRQTERTLTQKIRGKDNSEFFAPDGTYNDQQEIDIQSYGKTGTSVKDLNTTYTLGDLIRFYQDGSLDRMERLLEKLRQEKEESSRKELFAQARELETILPAAGISLAESANWYSNPESFLFEIYEMLTEVSRSIGERYEEYSNMQTGSWSEEAPSNLRYYIVNASTGKTYTNMEVNTYEEALEEMAALEDYTPLFAGIRSFDVMTIQEDLVLNESAGDWFGNLTWTGANEKVLLAVNTEYPVGDELQKYHAAFTRRGLLFAGWIAGAAVCLLVLISLFILFLRVAGKVSWQETFHKNKTDEIPVEVSMGIYLILEGILLQVILPHISLEGSVFSRNGFLICLVMIGVYLLFLCAAMDFYRKRVMGLLWRNSMLHMLLVTWKQVNSARIHGKKFLISYLAFFICNLLFLYFFGSVGVIFALILDMAVLLYLLQELSGKQSIWQGIDQISQGNLSYKIDTANLKGEAYQMGQAMNEMGDSLSEALETVVRNERLKAELITNVSHDLKTPLTSIVNYVDLLKRENLQEERAVQYIEILEQKAYRLKQLTEDLVEASRISSGNIKLEMMPLSYSDILQQAIGEFQDRFEKKGLVLITQIPRDPCMITADGSQLWRILENLFSNLCKYAQECSQIELSLIEIEEENQFRLKICNQSETELTIRADELTGRFVRGDKSRSTEGSGLGLSIVQNLAQLMGGSFQIHLEGKNFETWLDFPMYKV